MTQVYQVKFRSVGSRLWTKARLTGDSNMLREGVPVRVLICEDGGRIELPMDKFELHFGKDRMTCILKNMEREAGQKLNVEGVPQ